MLFTIITNTPLWVWGILVTLTLYGKYLSKNRKVKESAIYILPLIIITLSILASSSSPSNSLISSTCWVMGSLCGFASFLTIKGPDLGRYLDEEKSFEVFGSWIPYVLMICIFCTKYVVGVVTAMQLPILDSLAFTSSVSFIYGAISGIFIFRTYSLFRIKNNQKVDNLSIR